MKRYYGAVLTTLFAFGLPLSAMGQHNDKGHHGHASPGDVSAKAELQQKTCPVSGKPVNPDVSVEHEGETVYFCCQGCVPKFKESPNKYLPSVYRQIYPQQIQVKCPVMGGEINPEVYVEHEGRRVYFCCKGCDSKFEADPAKYLDKLPEITTTQVHCPVMGKVINPELSAEVDGKTVYFCCKMCEPKFKADPAKYPVSGPREAGLVAHGKTAKDDLFLCPVCAEKGSGIHRRGDVEMVDIDGFRYAMCGPDCVAKFKENKKKYLQILQARLIEQAATTHAGDKSGKVFTCPMHPQIVTETAGQCPICEMNLKPAERKE